MAGFKFDPQKIHKLDDPQRLQEIPPDYIFEKINHKNPQTILDIGAGTGLFSMWFARHDSVKKVYALDIADEMISWMNEYVAPDYPNIVIKRMEESKINLPGSLADVVIMINLHHELDEPVKMLKEVHRLLKENGKLAIVDWLKKATEHGPPESKRLKPEKISKQIQKAGFATVTIHEGMNNHFLITADKKSG